jgi:hypothetical protein
LDRLQRVQLYDKCEISDTMSNTAEGLSEEAEDNISQVTYSFDFVGMCPVLPGGRCHGHFPQIWQFLKAEWP